MLAYSFFGIPIYTKEGRNLPAWQKKYDVRPHERAHGRHQWAILRDIIMGRIKTSNDLKRRLAQGEIEAYWVSISSLERYLEALKRQKEEMETYRGSK